MPRFTKSILSSGKFLASVAGGRRLAEFSSERLNRIASTANKMIAAGLRIPAPFDHSPDAVPVAIDGKPASSFNNAGFWERFWVATDKVGRPTLYGEVNADGDINDPNSPAGKVGKSVKECSLSVRESYTDGTGREWKDDPLMHVALCLHPVDYSQDNFKLSEPDLALSMSCLMSTEYNIGDISLLRQKLKSVANLFLPENCTGDNLVGNLLVSLQQAELSKNGDSDSDDSKIVIEPSPTFLSTDTQEMKFTKEQADALVATKAINPATQKPFELKDFGIELSTETPTPTPAPTPTATPTDEKYAQLSTFAAAVQNELLETRKGTLAARVEALVKSNRTTRDYADKALLPQVQQLSLSFDSGKIAKTAVESTIEALEAIPMPTRGTLDFNLPGGATVHEPDFGGADHVELSDADMDKLAEQLSSMI